jgi:hypothetical protein
MSPTLNGEVLFAAGYVAFLSLASIGLEWMARFSHRQAHRARLVGFRYHPHVSAWECSEGHFLWLKERDDQHGVAYYKADARTCNACPVKDRCTDADDGRELLHSLNAWSTTELAQFQRTISLMLLLLGALILIAEVIRHHNGPELLLLGLNTFALTGLGVRMLASFRKRSQDDSGKEYPQVRWEVLARPNSAWKRRWW